MFSGPHAAADESLLARIFDSKRLLSSPEKAVGAHSAEILSLAVRQLEREANHSPPFSAEVKHV